MFGAALATIPPGVDGRRALEEVKRRVNGKDGPASDSAEASVGFLRSEHTLVRFLIARQWDADKAVLMLREHFAWLAQTKMSALLLDPFPEEGHIKKYYPQTFHGTDKMGRPIYIERPGRMDMPRLLQAASFDRLLQYMAVGSELQIRRRLPACSLARGEVVDKSLNILDLDGLGPGLLGDPTARKAVKEVVGILQNHYPECAGKTIFINAPRVFSWAWSFVKPMLDAKTLAKISIFGTDKKAYQTALLDLVDADQLPTLFGGRCKCDGKDELSCMTCVKGPWADPEIMQILDEEPLERIMTPEGCRLLVERRSRRDADAAAAASVAAAGEAATAATSAAAAGAAAVGGAVVGAVAAGDSAASAPATGEAAAGEVVACAAAAGESAGAATVGGAAAAIGAAASGAAAVGAAAVGEAAADESAAGAAAKAATAIGAAVAGIAAGTTAVGDAAGVAVDRDAPGRGSGIAAAAPPAVAAADASIAGGATASASESMLSPSGGGAAVAGSADASRDAAVGAISDAEVAPEAMAAGDSAADAAPSRGAAGEAELEETLLQEEYRQHEEVHMATLVQWVAEFNALTNEIGRPVIERAQGYYDRQALLLQAQRDFSRQREFLQRVNSSLEAAKRDLHTAEAAFEASITGAGGRALSDEEWVRLAPLPGESGGGPAQLGAAPLCGPAADSEAGAAAEELLNARLIRTLRLSVLGDKVARLQTSRDVAQADYAMRSQDLDECKARFDLEEQAHSACTWNCSVQRAAPFYEKRRMHEAKIEAQLAVLRSLEERLDQARQTVATVRGPGAASTLSSERSLVDFGEMTLQSFEIAGGAPTEDDFLSCDAGLSDGERSA